MILRLALLLLLAALPLRAEEIVAGLSQSRVSITASFDGSEILIFGAIKRETPIPRDAPLSVIIAVSGPDQAVTVRRKARHAGIWVNADAVAVDRAPSFYAVATSGPLATTLHQTEDLRHKITIRRAIRAVGQSQSVPDAPNFTEALIRIREENGLYQLREGSVEFQAQTLFRTSIALPANLVEGDYVTRMYLTRGGDVVATYATTIGVQKVGLERWIYNLAHERPLIYGILSLVIAIAAGWAASAVFRYLRT